MKTPRFAQGDTKGVRVITQAPSGFPVRGLFLG